MRQYHLFSLQRYAELQLTISAKTFGSPLLHGYNNFLARYKIPYHFVVQIYSMCLLLLVIKTFPLKKGARESSFQLFTKNSIKDSLKLEFFRATVQLVGLFWDGPLILYVVDKASRSMCSISLIEGVNHLSATKWIIYFHYTALSDLKLIVLFLQMCPVDLFASAEKKQHGL